MTRPTRPLPRLSRLLPGVFYGWVIAVALGLVAFACVGIGFYSVALFLDALCREHGWSKTSVSAASTLYFLVTGVVGTLVGRLLDRYGGPGWIAAGACLLGIGLALVGQLREPWQLWPVYGLMAVGFSMSSNVPTSALLTRWFVQLRSRAMAVSQTGVSLGGILLVPFATYLIQTRGLESATLVLGALVVVLAVPIALFVLRWDPLAHGLEPDGGAFVSVRHALLSEAHQRREWRTRDALATRAFWLLALAFSAILFSQVGTLVHEIALVREHLEPQAAALALSTTAAGSLIGRLCVGLFADRLDKRRVGMALFAVQACALVGFSLAASPFALYAAAFCFGLTIGNIFMLQGLLVAELFGIPSFGRVFGTLQLLTQIAGGMGPVAVGYLFEWTGGYTVTLRVLAAVALAAAAALSRVRLHA